MYNSTSSKSHLNSDILTIISISIIVFIVQNILHEFVGHGGATLLVGGKLVSLSTAYLENDIEFVSESGRRFIAAAGTIVNIVVGLFFWAILKKQAHKTGGWRFFIWLSLTVNLLTGTGYFLFSGALGVGDWNVVISGLESYWFWRISFIFSGIMLYLISIWISLRELNMILGGDGPFRKKQAFTLSFVPYWAGSLASTMGALFNPLSILYVFTSAASTFGGASALAWMTQLLPTKWFPKVKNDDFVIARSRIWIAVSIIVLFIHVFIIGPGVRF